MSLLRAFIAIDLPSEIKKAISTQTASLRKESGRVARWVATENIHLTLKFLGEISSTHLEMLTQAICAECAQVASFQVSVEQLGCFPNPRRPRVIWIGLIVPPELNRLQRQIEASTTRLGYASDEKPFSPHLTIGRVREQATATELQMLRTLLESTSIAALGTFTVNETHLYKSDLKPDGPVYTRLVSTPLARQGSQ
jgi:2'-5' RNA ligase